MKRVLELYAGGGGSALGIWRALRHHHHREPKEEHHVRVEMDPDACATLRANGCGVLEMDVRDYARIKSGDKVFDLAWASFPCQCWSTAGDRAGARDERNGWPWTVACLDVARPRWFIAENVPGLTYHRAECDRDDPYACPACYFHDVILLDLGARYDSVQWVILDAADFGVPQHRRRVFIVAGPAPILWPQPTHGDPRQLSLFSVLEPWVTIGQALGLSGVIDGGRNFAEHPNQERPVTTEEPCPAIGGRGNTMFVEGSNKGRRHPPKGMDELATSVDTAGGMHLRVLGGGANPRRPDEEHVRNLRDITDEPSTTIPAHASGNAGPFVELLDRPAATVTTTEVKGTRGRETYDGGGVIDRASDQLWLATGRRRLTVEECAVLQGLPRSYILVGNKTSQYRQVGNMVPPQLAEALVRQVLLADRTIPNHPVHP